jgi:hypothetical protein
VFLGGCAVSCALCGGLTVRPRRDAPRITPLPITSGGFSGLDPPGQPCPALPPCPALGWWLDSTEGAGDPTTRPRPRRPRRPPPHPAGGPHAYFCLHTPVRLKFFGPIWGMLPPGSAFPHVIGQFSPYGWTICESFPQTKLYFVYKKIQV